MAKKRAGKPSGARELTVRVKTARGRKYSSKLWLERQLNDPYVQRAKAEGFRSRAAYKLIEIDDKLSLLKPGLRVVDLGAAPGGWTQICVDRVNALGDKPGPKGAVLAMDILEMAPIPGATILQLDFMAETAEAQLRAALGGKADLVLSDMAAPATGHKSTDHLRIIAMCEAAAYFAFDALAPEGAFMAKALQGGTEGELLTLLKRRFKTVRHIKPPASRSDSAEIYVVAMGFRPDESET